jgi:hypothetical protein
MGSKWDVNIKINLKYGVIWWTGFVCQGVMEGFCESSNEYTGSTKGRKYP